MRASQGSREAKAVGMLISAAILVKLVPSPLQSGASAMAWRLSDVFMEYTSRQGSATK